MTGPRSTPARNGDASFLRLARLLHRHRKAVAVFGGVWFWAGIAIHARFIALPDWLAQWSGAFFWLGVAANAIWWAAIRPALTKALARDGEPAAERTATPAGD